MELIYKIEKLNKLNRVPCQNVRWINESDIILLNDFMKQNNLRSEFTYEKYKKLNLQGIFYCGCFLDNMLLATACVEKFSDTYWDASDIRTLIDARNKGYGKQVTYFITKYILEQGKIATCYTKNSNIYMIKIIKDLGYENFMELDKAKEFYSKYR